MTTPSNFNARSDRAALALKAGMKDRSGQPLQQRSVPVGEDGQPERPLPPEGSYARQAIERQRAATAAARATAAEQPGALPAEQPGTSPNGQPQAEPEATQTDPQLSPNAQRRFGELAQTLRQKDQELQSLTARQRQLEEAAAAERARAEAAEARFNAMVQQNLENLDPETRMAVMQDAKIQEAVAQMENRLLGKIAPAINSMQSRAVQTDLERVAQKYSAFDANTHVPLIEMFREKNPNCSIEQAFRAIAEPEELMTGAGRAPTIPPIATPTPGNGSPKYVPQQSQQTSAEQEIEEDRKRAFELARSTKPLDRRHAGAAMDKLIRSKLGNGIPDTRPTYRR